MPPNTSTGYAIKSVVAFNELIDCGDCLKILIIGGFITDNNVESVQYIFLQRKSKPEVVACLV